MRKVIIFCSEYITCLGAIRCLGEAGIRPECYCYSKYEDYILTSKYISKGKKFDSPEDVIDFLLNDYPLYEEKPVLFTIPDPPAYYVDMNFDKLKDKFILMNAGVQGGIAYWMDKKNIANLAEKCGLKTPWMLELSKEDIIPGNLDYPVFTKSLKTVDGGKCDEGICWSEKELKQKKTSFAASRFLIMKYVEKVKEINYFGIVKNKHVYIDFCDERTRLPKDGYGHYSVFRLCNHDEIYEKITRMVLETGYEGLFDVEFLEDSQSELYFMEINFRVDGAVYKLCPGVNLMLEWCKLVELEPENLPEKIIVKKTNFTGMTEFSDFKVGVLGRLVNPFVWFIQFLKAEKKMWINLQDPKPTLVRIINEIKKHL